MAGKSQSVSMLGRAFSIGNIENDTVTLVPRAGSRGYITEKQQSQITEILREILGQPIQTKIKQREKTDQAQASPGQAGGITERQLAMQLPLVMQINEMFDVTLVQVVDDKSADLPVETDSKENSEEEEA